MADPIILIPARLAATRLPNKPLADLHGEPMIVHVWRRACEASIGPVAVATDASAIADVVSKAGGEAVPADVSLVERQGRRVALLEQRRDRGCVVSGRE